MATLGSDLPDRMLDALSPAPEVPRTLPPGQVHRHAPHTPISERTHLGLRYVVFACECGEELPERRA